MRVSITIGTTHKVWFVVHSMLNSTLLSVGPPPSYVVKGNSAYYDIKRKAKKFNVYVVRCKEGKDNYQESQPCMSCQEALKSIGFKKIYYSTFDGKIENALDKINNLSTHFKKNKNDKHSTLGLLKAVNRRKRLLSYLKRKSPESYAKILTKLNLRK